MRLILFGFILAVALVEASVADDHGNNASTATLITDTQVTQGTFIPGNIETAGDVDFFKFEVKTDQTGFLYIIETSIPQSDPTSDTYLRLLGTNGTTQLAADDDSGEGYASKILWVPGVAGVYYVEVSQSLPDDTGTYSISVLRSGQAPDDDHGDDPSTATLLEVNQPAVAGETEIPGDADFFFFVAEAGKFYDIETLNLGSGSDTVITLFKSDGQTLIGSDDQSGRSYGASRLMWIAPTDIQAGGKEYYVRVNQFFETAQGTWAIKITDRGLPTPLKTDGSPLAGILSAAGEAAACVFEGTRYYTTRIGLTTTNEINDFELRLVDRDDGITVLKTQKSLAYDLLEYTHARSGANYLIVTEPYAGGAYVLSATASPPRPRPDINYDNHVDSLDQILLMEWFNQDWEE